MESLNQSTNNDIFNRIQNWIRGLASEIGWWDFSLYKVKYCNDLRKERLHPREFVYDFDSSIKVNAGDIVVDIGSGPLPVYGDRIKKEKIKYIPLDPLAYEYKKLYQKYDINVPVAPSFALMEGLSHYLARSVDYVICNNAMDHCIDPVCAVIECLKAVRLGGVVLLAHLDSEAEHANYEGLHQWNITVRENELFFNNREHEFNISKMLKNYCSVEIKQVGDNGGRSWNVVKITKNEEITNTFQLKYTAEFYISIMGSCLMEALADCNGLYLPSGEACIPDDKKYIIWGTGNVAIQALSWFGNKIDAILYFIDNAVHDEKTTWHGIQVRNPAFLEKQENDFILVASVAYADEIQKQLVSMGFAHGNDFLLFHEFQHDCVHRFMG